MNALPAQYTHLTRLMDAAEIRQRVLSHNLANVNTPGYERLDVAFEELLSRHVAAGGPAGELPTPQVIVEQGLPARADGNTVDVDREVTQLNRNALLFQTYSQLLTSHFDLMRRAIS